MKTTARRLVPSGRRLGFTIVEVVMAFIIIGILTLVLTPVLINRSKEAKVNAAMQDLQSLADAEERAANDTGYLYRVYVLNDTRGIGIQSIPAAVAGPNEFALPSNRPNSILGNGILNGTWNGISGTNMYANPAYIFISQTQPCSFLDATSQQNIWKVMASNETSFNWNGPYLNWHRDLNRNDWPDDPWGNDYLFFTANGVIYPPDRSPQHPDEQNGSTSGGASTTGSSGITSGGFMVLGPIVTLSNGSQKQFQAQYVFDRPTFLSLGPNGLPGNGSTDINDGYGKGDDLIYQFGGN